MWGEYFINNLLNIESSNSPDDVWAMLDLRWRDKPKSDTGKVEGLGSAGSFLAVASWLGAQQCFLPQGTAEEENRENCSLQPK